MTSVRRRGQLAQRRQASKAHTSRPSSNRSDNVDHEDPLRLDKPGTSKTSTHPKAPIGPEIPAGPEVFSRPS